MRVLAWAGEEDPRAGAGATEDDRREGGWLGGREERLGTPFGDELVDFLRRVK